MEGGSSSLGVRCVLGAPSTRGANCVEAIADHRQNIRTHSRARGSLRDTRFGKALIGSSRCRTGSTSHRRRRREAVPRTGTSKGSWGGGVLAGRWASWRARMKGSQLCRGRSTNRGGNFHHHTRSKGRRNHAQLPLSQDHRRRRSPSAMTFNTPPQWRPLPHIPLETRAHAASLWGQRSPGHTRWRAAPNSLPSSNSRPIRAARRQGYMP